MARSVLKQEKRINFWIHEPWHVQMMKLCKRRSEETGRYYSMSQMIREACICKVREMQKKYDDERMNKVE